MQIRGLHGQIIYINKISSVNCAYPTVRPAFHVLQVSEKVNSLGRCGGVGLKCG